MRALRFLTSGLLLVAAVLLVAMMLVSVMDVLLRISGGTPIFGAYELVELALAGVAFLAIPEACRRDQHLLVDLVDQVASRRVVQALRVFATVMSLGFLAVLCLHMIDPLIEKLRYEEITINLQLPLWWSGALILLGFAAALLAVVGVLVRQLISLRSNESIRENE